MNDITKTEKGMIREAERQRKYYKREFLESIEPRGNYADMQSYIRYGVLVAYNLDSKERDKLKTKNTWPDHSDINGFAYALIAEEFEREHARRNRLINLWMALMATLISLAVATAIFYQGLYEQLSK